MTAMINRDIIESYLSCKYKGHLKLAGKRGARSDYELLLAGSREEVRNRATDRILARYAGEEVERDILLTPAALKRGDAFLLNVTLEDESLSLTFDGLARVQGTSRLGGYHYTPVLFTEGRQVRKTERALLGVYALLLSRLQGRAPATGIIWHGKEPRETRLRLSPDPRQAEGLLGELRQLQVAATPPRLVLNKHCSGCEFRRQCRAAAVDKDDLSLLGGLSPKQVAGLNSRGVFTVTQYSYTFRPGRMKRVAEGAGKKHDLSLQALAVREGTVYVARRPELPDGRARLYLDVEGLPDEDRYYLIGLTVAEGGTRRRLSFWADGRPDEAAIWASFLKAVGAVEDFVLFHYGSYESRFLDRMEGRHGGDPGLLARIKARSVNVLSLIYSRVYFPVYVNDLKSVASCLGFQWSASDASGLTSIAWRCAWEATGNATLKQQLLTYNEEDCSALERVVEVLRSLGGERPPSADSPAPPVADVGGLDRYCRHRYGTPRFALPEFARITKCAYFDYQRDKVICRTNPGVRKVVRSRVRPKRRPWKVNQEVECGTPVACPHCGSQGFDQHSRYRKLVIDLKPFRGGMKRWVTRYKVRRYRCRKCWNTLLPDDYLAVSSHKYGWVLCSWVAYATVSLRLTNDALGEALDDLFGIPMPSGSLSKVRQRVVAYYRGTYESLLSALRSGRLVHADETKVKIKGLSSDGYVWVFATPETVVYVYAPTRDGDTARETLAGFKGVLVSDFYAAYDALDCPQQKCLIHLIRDFNDDLLRHPFDEELKEQAARFTGLLQAMVETVDRYGLKRHHLRKHKGGVDRFYAVESRAGYESELARHYQHRLMKYRDKLFTFLDYDGIPWNNNNAENAIKRFVSRRKTMGTPFTESGIRDYLLLLSICQTLRYRSAGFWKFLLSGETDIDSFTAGRRRRPV
jgi:predicted RecB family nuclease